MNKGALFVGAACLFGLALVNGKPEFLAASLTLMWIGIAIATRKE